MPNKAIAAAVSAVVLAGLVGCSTSSEQKTARELEQAWLDSEIEARQGAEVGRVCTRRNVGWRSFGDDALLLEADGQWYRLKLAGTCDPERAFATIASRGSSCVRRGDSVFTSRPRDRERCVITAIYEWDARTGSEEQAEQ